MPGSWREGTVSGYYDSAEAAIDSLPAITSARGIYVTLNPIKPDLHARAYNRLRLLGQRDPVTADQDILRRRWLPIDCDAVRPSGISATDEEHELAIERAAQIRAVLADEGWPHAILADLGNGGHLLFSIDMPADDQSKVKRCLAALARRFDDDRVKIDQTVHNPARIWRLYGTRAAKGDHTPTRPHRRSRIIDVPPLRVAR